MKKLIFAVAMMLSVCSIAQARDQIRVVGSSTVFPFATVVAENFGNSTKFKTPIVESTGSGGGLKLFCAGLGDQTPDFTNASRRIKSSEIERCKNNGVTEILEVKIGYDGIVIANSKNAQELSLTRRDLFLALAKQIPDTNGKLVKNTNKTWKDVREDLPNAKIEILGPPPTSGTRDAFVELAMEAGAKTFSNLKALRKKDKKKFKAIAHTIREDGHYIEVGENDNLIVQKLNHNNNAIGIFGFSFLDNNQDKIQAASIDNIKPTFENISDGSYKISRSLFFYAKKQHFATVPGMQEYIDMFISNDASGDYGYLTDDGLIPLSSKERESMVTLVK